MRITKQLAEDLSKLIFKPSTDKLDKMHEAHNDMCYDLYVKTLPKDLYETLKKYPSHIGQNLSGISHTNVQGGVYNISCNKKSYLILTGYTYNKLDHSVITEKESLLVRKSYEECVAYKRNLEKKTIELYETLLGLRTKKRVLDVMPELEKYFPKDSASNNMNGLMVVNPQLIQVIKNQPL